MSLYEPVDQPSSDTPSTAHRRTFSKPALVVILAMAALSAAVAGLLVYATLDNRRVAVRKVEVMSSRVPSAFDGFTILQITDLHQRRFGQDQSDLLTMLAGLDFDAVLLTGDYVLQAGLLTKCDLEPTLELVRGLRDRAPVYFVLGNYEGSGEYSFYPEPGNAVARLLNAEDAIHVYPAQRIEQSGEWIWLSDWSTKPYDDLACMWPGAPPFPAELDEEHDYIIAVTHRPLDLENPDRLEAAHAGACEGDYAPEDQLAWSLNISGHTHGGQVRLPGVGPLISPNEKGRLPFGLLPKHGDRYVYGVHVDGQGRTQVISSGLGASGPFLARFRLFNTPEVMLVTLRRQ